MRCGAVARSRPISGTWTGSSSRSTARSIPAGGRSTRTGTCSISWLTSAALAFLRKLLKSLASVPRVVITDKLASYYRAAMHEVLPSIEHRRHKGLNNRAENPHQPTRERERRMRRFKSAGHAQWFLAAYGPVASHFRPRRHRLIADAYRRTSAERFAAWRVVSWRMIHPGR